MCKAGMLGRRMKSNIGDVDSWSKRYGKGLDGAIEVLIVERIFIVPDARTGIRYFGAHEPDAIASRIGFSLNHCRPGPGPDCWLLAYGRANGAKVEICRPATHVLPLIGG